MKYFILGFLAHVLMLNLIWLDAHLAWNRVKHIKLPERWEAWDRERICNNDCEMIVRLEFGNAIGQLVR